MHPPLRVNQRGHWAFCVWGSLLHCDEVPWNGLSGSRNDDLPRSGWTPTTRWSGSAPSGVDVAGGARPRATHTHIQRPWRPGRSGGCTPVAPRCGGGQVSPKTPRLSAPAQERGALQGAHAGVDGEAQLCDMLDDQCCVSCVTLQGRSQCAFWWQTSGWPPYTS